VIIRYLIILVVAIATPCFSQENSIKGVFAISADELAAQPVPLNTEWTFYPNQLVAPSEINNPSASFIQVPSSWTQSDNPTQAATYRLKVLLPKGTPALAIYMPEVYCAYNLFVNGKKIGSNGIVGHTKEDSKPQWKPETYELTTSSATLDIVIQLSNFYHHRTGIGIPILLGKTEHLGQIKATTEISNILSLSGLAILSIAALILYFIRSQNQALLFYFLLCTTWMLRVAFSDHYQIVQWYPDINWYLGVRIEYITIYLTTLFGSLLVGNLFPQDVNSAFRWFFVITCVCFTAITLVAPPVFFTSFLQVYLGLGIVLLVSILVIVVKAYFESRNGAGFVMLCALLGVIIFGYVILYYEGFIQLNELAYNIGFLIEFILLFFAVTQRINKMNTTSDFQNRMTFDEVIKMK